ncbi:VOC family protein [Pseudoclavibacter helvolus]|uniref:VOC family protein n=1 Tax=Pseudoclavibacter helvolus TaxID=255205 RepID=UPI0030B7FEEE
MARRGESGCALRSGGSRACLRPGLRRQGGKEQAAHRSRGAPARESDRTRGCAARRGATRADVGQGDDVTWVVLRDPEGNEFCVLSSRES